MSEQPAFISYLQGLGLDVDQNTVIMFLMGTALIAAAALGVDGLFLALLLFGRPLFHQFMAQVNSGPPGSNPLEGLAAASSNTMKNLFGSQDLTAIVSKIISSILPALLRATSQFVTDQANQPLG